MQTKSRKLVLSNSSNHVVYKIGLYFSTSDCCSRDIVYTYYILVHEELSYISEVIDSLITDILNKDSVLSSVEKDINYRYTIEVVPSDSYCITITNDLLAQLSDVYKILYFTSTHTDSYFFSNNFKLL